MYKNDFFNCCNSNVKNKNIIKEYKRIKREIINKYFLKKNTIGILKYFKKKYFKNYYLPIYPI
jgi:hypothetical protein